ncbi:MAG: sugar ABC transporter permease, partial [Lachnospiraceae bacterium]|nr:sugar ABC transporter permease [Lachnospiraceae bacterium]
MREKVIGFNKALHDSSWKVKLSGIIMGAGQFLYGCRTKGILFLLLEISIIYYFVSRGINDIRGF